MIFLQSQAIIPTTFGDYKISAYAADPGERNPTILLSSLRDTDGNPVVRLHSECITGEVFGSLKCDCGPQLARALEIIHKEGGHLIYLRQEGRDIGIINKLKAYALQQEGMNTLEANLHLGFEADGRNYKEAVDILKLLKISKLRLITNNPAKIAYLEKEGIEVTGRIPLIIPAQEASQLYLDVKRDLMGHLL